jgi:hypothetical protein
MSEFDPILKRQYRYYSIGSSNPVRVVYDANGLKIRAETPDQSSGSLKINMLMLSRIEISYEAEEIDRDRFEALCAAIYAKKV